MISSRKFPRNGCLWLFALLYVLEVLPGETRWCTKREPVYRTRTVQRQGYRWVTKANWWGTRKTVPEPYTYTEIEHYLTTEVRDTCCRGYELKDGNCEPICRGACPPHSYCYLPDLCVCLLGYVSESRKETLFECLPECRNGCPLHSTCTAPHHCSCDVGYAMGNAGADCLPLCSGGCPAHSSCVAPELCRCEDGYQMNSVAKECEPICLNGCPANSACLQPEQCQCEEGYRLKRISEDHEYCEPICQRDCSDYGKCVRPGVCECLAGFEESKVGGPLCRPRCSHGCQHGFCFAPEICVCDPGYLMGPNATCAPVCSLGCVHGECVEPEICSCLAGYRLQANSVNICEAVCEPACENGDCVAPDVCACWNKYQPTGNSSTVCRPTCSPECLRGYCNASHECSCHAGYEAPAYASHECRPVCKDCHNGECVAPGVCQCGEGYVVGTSEAADASGQEVQSCVLMASSSTAASTMTVLSFDSLVETTVASTIEPSAELPAFETTTFQQLTSEDPNQSDDSNPNAELVAAQHCQTLCKCWSEFDELGSLSGATCRRLCVDAFDQPCLDWMQCRCDLNKLELVCNNSVAYSSEQADEQPGLRYTCTARLRLTVVAIPTESSLNQSAINANGRQPEFVWWLILVGVVVVLIGTVTVLAVWRRARNNNSGGDLNIGFYDESNGL